jgi:hypothetical protein
MEFGGVSSLIKPQLMPCYSAKIWVYCFLDHVIVMMDPNTTKKDLPIGCTFEKHWKMKTFAIFLASLAWIFVKSVFAVFIISEK